MSEQKSVAEVARETLVRAIEHLRHDKNGICYINPCARCLALAALLESERAAARDEALEQVLAICDRLERGAPAAPNRTLQDHEYVEGVSNVRSSVARTLAESVPAPKEQT